MRVRRLGAVGIAVGTLLGVTGCTNSDVLTPGNGTLRVRVVLENAPTRFERAFFTIRQIRVEPSDPQSQDVIVEPFALINPRDTREINGSIEGLQYEIDVNLGVGSWQVTSIALTGFFYEDLDPPASTVTCEDYAPLWAGTPDPDPFEFPIFANSSFTIEPGRVNELTVAIDHQAFLSALQDSFFCVPFGSFGCGEPWCVLGFNPVPTTLFLQAPQYLSFE